MNGLIKSLQDIEKNIANLGPDYSNSLQKLEVIKERLVKQRFHLAVLGQFKRGKSTLINALLGEEIMPSAVVPLTAIPTFLLYGTDIRLRVFYQNNNEKDEFSYTNPEELLKVLSQYVTEEQNPNNQKGIESVEVFYPSKTLSEGLILIDTPGIGSTLQHNTEVTYNFLPQCDAALFVVSADPPLTEVEINFLRDVKDKVSRIFFVLNKVDYLTQAERETMVNFLQATLQEKILPKQDFPIFCTAARQGLKAQRTNDEHLWETSGLAELSGYLTEFLAKDKADALEEALTQKAWDVVNDVLSQVQVTIRSLEMPIDDLNQRLETFAKLLGEIEQEQILVFDMLAGEKKRILEHLEEEAAKLKQQAATKLEEALEYHLANEEDLRHDIQKTFDQIIPSFFADEFNKMSKKLETKITAVLKSHQQRADRILNLIRQTAAKIFDIPYYGPSSSEKFELKHKPYWISEKWETRLMVIPDSLLKNFCLPKYAILGKSTE